MAALDNESATILNPAASKGLVAWSWMLVGFLVWCEQHSGITDVDISYWKRIYLPAGVSMGKTIILRNTGCAHSKVLSTPCGMDGAKCSAIRRKSESWPQTCDAQPRSREHPW
jgi:hypothetical protein